MTAGSSWNPKLNPAGWLIALFSVLGMGVMAYLTYLHFAGGSSFCDLSATVSCSTVNKSIYSEVFGIPISILGFGFFAAILGIILQSAEWSFAYPLIFISTVAMLVPSLYLSYVEYFVIKSVCIFCETSKVLMLLIAATAFFQIRKTGVWLGWLSF